MIADNDFQLGVVLEHDAVKGNGQIITLIEGRNDNADERKGIHYFAIDMGAFIISI